MQQKPNIVECSGARLPKLFAPCVTIHLFHQPLVCMVHDKQQRKLDGDVWYVVATEFKPDGDACGLPAMKMENRIP